jgi:hypothetical protein
VTLVHNAQERSALSGLRKMAAAPTRQLNEASLVCTKYERGYIHDPITIKYRRENKQSPSAFNDGNAVFPADEIECD